jgi:acetolactate synthase-1/2/3 large subunit
MVRMRISIVIIVLNNGVLGYQKDAEQVKFGAYTSACHFAPVNHADMRAPAGVDRSASMTRENFVERCRRLSARTSHG